MGFGEQSQRDETELLISNMPALDFTKWMHSFKSIYLKKKVLPIVTNMYCHHLFPIVSLAVMNNVTNLCLIECHTFHVLII